MPRFRPAGVLAHQNLLIHIDYITTLGATRMQPFRRVVLTAPALTTGAALAFARAVGEYGSVIFIAGQPLCRRFHRTVGGKRKGCRSSIAAGGAAPAPLTARIVRTLRADATG